jgi:hypothetical protein
MGKIPRRLLIFIAFTTQSTAIILQGPSKILGLPDWVTLTCIGLGLSLAAQSFITTPTLPEALEGVYIKHGFIEGKNEALDQALSAYGSGLYGTFYSIGAILAPIIGSAIYE